VIRYNILSTANLKLVGLLEEEENRVKLSLKGQTFGRMVTHDLITGKTM